MNRMYWTTQKAADLLVEAYLVDLGRKGPSPDPIALEALARALDTRPEVLEQVWDAWDDRLILAGWSKAQRDRARDWLDVVVIGGISTN